MDKWPGKYTRLVNFIKDGIVNAAQDTDDPSSALMLTCDVSAAVMLEVYTTDEQRLAALDVFLTRLGNVMDRAPMQGAPN